MIYSNKKKRFSVMLKRFFDSLLYHTKNCRGTTTRPHRPHRPPPIIPYQELSGNYNLSLTNMITLRIIPYQELSGSYNTSVPVDDLAHDYTIPRTVRELQLKQTVYPTGTVLYHTKNCRGTTTTASRGPEESRLYHTKNCRGTTTQRGCFCSGCSIIPYQELSVNCTHTNSIRFIQHTCQLFA